MTDRQHALLRELVRTGPRHVSGADLVAARHLAKLELVVLEDAPEPTAFQRKGRRWVCRPTAKATNYRTVWSQLYVGTQVEYLLSGAAGSERWLLERVVQFSPGGNYVHISCGGNAVALTKSEVERRVRIPAKVTDHDHR